MNGQITLVGAGPGDIELLTIKGRRKLQEADVIVYDRLVNRELLSYGKPGCELIYVGKEPQYHPVPQDQIEALLIEKVQAGKQVVRLKGGDPYVFGRGGEEGKTLLEHGISFDVVPGITSAIGGLAYGGIPITYREKAGSFHVITAHRSADGLDLDWDNLAKLTGTLVFLMGVSELATICYELQQGGLAATTPAAVVHWATRSNQVTAQGTLATIVSRVAEAGITSPSLIVVGEVVEMRTYLNVFEERSLFGQQLLIPNGTKHLQSLLIDNGAGIVSFQRGELKEANWQLPTRLPEKLIFTERESWWSFLAKWHQAGKDLRTLEQKISAVGHHTCQEIENSGIQLTHKVSNLSELATDNALIFSSRKPPSEGLIVTHHVTYDTPYKAELADVTGICLPHSKAARELLAQYSISELKHLPLFVMGQETACVLENSGLSPHISEEVSFKSLLETLNHYFRRKCNEKSDTSC